MMAEDDRKAAEQRKRAYERKAAAHVAILCRTHEVKDDYVLHASTSV
jgi:hypothetical protein